MRCQFCGWDNPNGKTTCEKCNKPLTWGAQGDGVLAEGHDRPTALHPEGCFNPKATVRESVAGGVSETVREELCPKCGYPLDNGECAACGYSSVKAETPVVAAQAHRASELRKTVRPIRKGDKEGVFTLTPISEETGEPEGASIGYEGNEVALCRDNTDPKNPTITSSEQACITFENGVWGIVDRSEYKTTFVQAARKVELRSGDLILLGNQLYRFEL